MIRWCVLALPLLVLACSSDDEGGASKPKPEPKLVFEADARPAGTSLILREKAITGDSLVLELVGNSLTDLYGVAFRLRYDPDTLVFAKLEASPAWGGSTPMALGAAKTPGLLVGTLTHKGKASGVSGAEVVIGVLTFALSQRQPGAIDFVSDRGAFVAADGKPVPQVAFAGGDLELK